MTLKRYYPVLLALLVCVLLVGAGYRWGAGNVQAKWDAEMYQMAKAHLDEQKRTDTVTAKSAAQVAASDAAAEVRYQYIEKEVIKYVKSPAPAAACYDPEWLRLYNVSLGAVPTTPGGADGAAQDVPANP